MFRNEDGLAGAFDNVAYRKISHFLDRVENPDTDLSIFDEEFSHALHNLTGAFRGAIPLKENITAIDAERQFSGQTANLLKKRFSDYLRTTPAAREKDGVITNGVNLDRSGKLVHMLLSLKKVEPAYRVSEEAADLIRKSFIMDLAGSNTYFSHGLVRGYMGLSGLCGINLRDDEFKTQIVGTLMTRLENDLLHSDHRHHIHHQVSSVINSFEKTGVPFEGPYKDHVKVWLHQATELSLRDPSATNLLNIVANAHHALDRMGEKWNKDSTGAYYGLIAQRALGAIDASFKNGSGDLARNGDIAEEARLLMRAAGVGQASRAVFEIPLAGSLERAKLRAWSADTLVGLAPTPSV